ncbi:MAG: phosphoribosylformylglycinamidine synthase subunit PurQ [Chitinophagales bacterium]|nr:phosphoribosylformylglycinamidine synthase subunit PurQ [Hyphomicrobiales bacterium]
MRASVVVFPGSNCDRDIARTLAAVTGRPTAMVWHADTDLPESDLIVLPGGFSYGDYLRSGAMAAHSPVVRAVAERAKAGVAVLGVCNGFQVLTEAGLLPGALMRNASLKYVCRDITLSVERNDTIFTKGYEEHEPITIPVAHKDGCYFADDDTLDRIDGEGRVAFRYSGDNPNGSRRNIAGVYSENLRVLGLMPHPERLADPALGGTDGEKLFKSLFSAFNR